MKLKLGAHYHKAWEIDTKKNLRISPAGISDNCFYTECNYRGKISLNISFDGIKAGTRCTAEKHPTACSSCPFYKLGKDEFYKAEPKDK